MKNKGFKWKTVLLCAVCMLLLAGCQEDGKTPAGNILGQNDKKVADVEISDYKEYDYDQSSQDSGRKMEFHSAVNMGANNKEDEKPGEGTNNPQPSLSDPEIHFLNGKTESDCAIVKLPDGKILLYNVGSPDETFGKYLKKYLTNMKVDAIDYLVISDYSDNRIGQLKMLAQNFDTSKATVFVKGVVMKDGNAAPVVDEMKALQNIDAHAYDNYMSVMRIARESYGDVSFVNAESAEIKLGGMNLNFFNTDYTAYKDYRDWTLGCRMSYRDAAVAFLGGATVNVLDKYATQLDVCNAIRVSGHLKSYYSSSFYKALAPQMVVSQLPEATAKDTLEKSGLQNYFQENNIHSYVTGMSKSEVVLHMLDGQVIVANGVKPVSVVFEGYWTDWID